MQILSLDEKAINDCFRKYSSFTRAIIKRINEAQKTTKSLYISRMLFIFSDNII